MDRWPDSGSDFFLGAMTLERAEGAGLPEQRIAFECAGSCAHPSNPQRQCSGTRPRCCAPHRARGLQASFNFEFTPAWQRWTRKNYQQRSLKDTCPLQFCIQLLHRELSYLLFSLQLGLSARQAAMTDYHTTYKGPEV